MPYTYSGDPAASTRDAVRFAVGDTVVPMQLSDEEIAALLARVGGAAPWAAPLAADALAAKYSHQVSYSAGRSSRQLGDKAKQMRELAAQLRRELARYVVPVSTGQDAAADGIDAENEALKQQNFALGQMDNPRATRADSTPTPGETLP